MCDCNCVLRSATGSKQKRQRCFVSLFVLCGRMLTKRLSRARGEGKGKVRKTASTHSKGERGREKERESEEKKTHKKAPSECVVLVLGWFFVCFFVFFLVVVSVRFPFPC